MTKHLLSASQFTSTDQLDAVFRVADQAARDEKLTPIDGKIVIGFFDEPSTRTGPSFEAATIRLKGNYISHHAGDSSMRKGESFSDSLKTLSMYGDILVTRCPVAGEIGLAAAGIDKPIINAGDGAGEHPTQAILDLYTVQKCLGKIDGLTFLLTGDLGYSRTTRSLLRLLSLYDANIILSFTHPNTLNNNISQSITKERLTIISDRELPDWLGKADVLYMTRHQKERPGDRPQSKFVLTPEKIPMLKDGAIILHPLPRVNEIDPRVDLLPQAKYWQQVENGMWVRMALLSMMLDGYASW